jgi:lysozyme family protein
MANAADDHVTIDRMCDDRMEFLRGLGTWDRYGKGWTRRVEDVRKTAHGMVVDEPRPEPEPEPEPEPPAEGTAAVEITVVGNVTITINGKIVEW